jgi:hypothetical protein
METEKTRTQSKEVAKKTETAVQALGVDASVLDAWTTSQSDATELLIPKLLLMHATSELVQDGTFQAGALVRSTDKKVLGDAKKPIKIVPILYNRTWVENKYNGTQFQWDHERPWNQENAADAWEYEAANEKGELHKWKRQKAYNFYALIVDNNDPTQLPIVKIQFKSSSSRAGRTLADFFAKLQHINKTRMMQKKEPIYPASYIWELSSKLEKGDKNNYQTFIVTQAGETPRELISEAAQWFVTMTQEAHRVKDDNTSETMEAGLSEEAPF